MPKGLPSVVQPFGADSSDYIEALDQMIGKNEGLHNSLEGIGRDLAAFKRQLEDFARNTGGQLFSPDAHASAMRQVMNERLWNKMEEAEQQKAYEADMIKMANDHITKLREEQREIAKVALAWQEVRASAADQRIADITKQAQAASDARAVALEKERIAVAKLTQETERLGRAAERAAVAGQSAVSTTYSKLRSTSGSILTDALATAGIARGAGDDAAAIDPIIEAAAAIRRSAGGTFSKGTDALLLSRMIAGQREAAAASRQDVGSFADTFANAVAARLFPRSGGTDAAGDVAASVIGATAGAGLGSGLSGGGGGLSRGVLAAMAADEASRRYSSIIPDLVASGAVAAIASTLFNSGIGDTVRAAVGNLGGYALADAARNVAVRAAGGLGGLADLGLGAAGAIAGGGAFDLGRAGERGATIVPNVGRWLTIGHYIMMGMNEVLATAGPATVAGLAAGAVGLEGGQTLYGRMVAINAVGQSLGSGIGGQTPGQMLGLGDALQEAQTAADPQVWELLGAGINSIKAATDNASGGLSNFWQLGTNTLDMVDRFAAKVTLAFKGGEGKSLNDLVSQGTGDLQQFGDVLGNIGTTFLHVAPALPGVGGDLLSTLQGITKGASWLTGHIPTNLLGLGLAAEAGNRYGVGMVGSLANLMGRAPGGILGTVARTATADDVAAGLAAAEGDTIAGTGAAGALGSLGGASIAGIAAGAYAIGKTITAASPTQQWVQRLQTLAGQASFSQAGDTLFSNMNQFASIAGQAGSLSPDRAIGHGLAETFAHGDIFGGMRDATQGIFSAFGGPKVRTSGGTANVALQNAAQQLNELLSAGGQIQSATGGSLEQAYALADMAGLQTATAFKGGKLSAVAMQQIANTAAGYKAMSQSRGSLFANVGAVQIAQGLQGSQLGTVNPAWDQLISNAAGGSMGATGFAGSIQTMQSLGSSLKSAADAAEVTKLSASATKESTGAIAKALVGFTSPASQQAWSAFSNVSTTNPGLIQQAGSMLDWLRTAQTSGVLSGAQVAGAGAYQAQQLLPYARQSPAALAQLGILSQEVGGPAYQSGKTQAQNYAAISGAIDKAADSQKKYNATVTQGTIGLSDVSAQAQKFGSTMQEDAYAALAKGSLNLPKMSQDMKDFKAAAGDVNTSAFHAAAQSLAQDFKSVSASAGDVKAIIGSALSGKGLSASAIKGIVGQVQAAMNIKVSVSGAAAAESLKSLISSLESKDVNIHATANPAAVQNLIAAIAQVHGKSVSVVVTTINRVLSQYIGAATPAGGIAPATLAGSGGGMRLTNAQTGWRVPGYGGGDIFPAMLEPGEAVVPKHLVHQIAPFMAAHKVPGFAAGGIMDGLYEIRGMFGDMEDLLSQQLSGMMGTISDELTAAVSGLREGRVFGGGSAPSSAALPPAAVAAVAGAVTQAASQLAPGAMKPFAVTIIKGINDAAKDLGPEAESAAKGIVSQIATEVNYAKSTAASTVSGLGLSSLDTTQSTVAQSMQGYLSSIQSFTKDMHTLSKDGLSKGLAQQLIAAGPQQGDALAQSILGGGPSGGVAAVNQLWNAINKASKGLGAQAAMSVYGGTLAPNLKSGTFNYNNVSVSISMGGGGSSTTLTLSTAQIKQITAEVQKKLLQQAKQNRRTGTTLPGYGS